MASASVASTQGQKVRHKPSEVVTLPTAAIAGEASIRVYAPPKSRATEARKLRHKSSGVMVVSRKQFKCRKCGRPKTQSYGHRQHRGFSHCAQVDGDFDVWTSNLR